LTLYRALRFGVYGMDSKSQRAAVENAVRIAGRQVTCDDVKKALSEAGDDLTSWEIAAGSSIPATFQKHLESIPGDRVTKRFSPDGGTTFQWINRSESASGSLAATLRG
jgi:hypothetical protein